MDAKELRAKLFEDMERMSKEELIQELEDAGYVVRHDLAGIGLLNPDGNPFEYREETVHSPIGSYSTDLNETLSVISATVTHSVNGAVFRYGADPTLDVYSVFESHWSVDKDVKQWTSSQNSNLRDAS